MSGRGNPAPDVPDDRPCDQLRLEVYLIDIDTAAVANVAVGNRLRVGLIEDRYPAVFADGQRLGSIASGALSRLVQCLREGKPYVAEVLELERTLVKVLVSSP